MYEVNSSVTELVTLLSYQVTTELRKQEFVLVQQVYTFNIMTLIAILSEYENCQFWNQKEEGENF